MRRNLNFSPIYIIIILLIGSNIFGSSITFNKFSGFIEIGTNIEFIKTDKHKISFIDIEHKTNWKKCNDKYINKSFIHSIIWFRFKLKNISDKPIYFGTEAPKLKNITFFSLKNKGKFKNIKPQLLVFNEKKDNIDTLYPVFKILPDKEEKTYIFSVQSEIYPVIFHPILIDFNKLKFFSYKELWIFLSYLILMAFILILSLFYFILTKEKAFFIQFIYILLWIILQINYYGYGLKYLWKNSILIDKYIFILDIYAIGLVTVYIYQTYTNLKIKYPKINKAIINFMVYPILGGVISSFIIPFNISLPIALIIAIYTMIAEFFLSIYFMYKKNIPGIILFWGFLGMQVASIITILGIYGLYNNWFFIKYLNLFGNVWVIIALLFAMAYKYHVLQKKIKTTEEEKELLQFSVDKSSDIVFWVNSSAEFVYVNNAASEILGYSKQELMTKKVYEIVYGLDREGWMKSWRQLSEKNKIKRELVFIKKDGTITLLEIVGNHIIYKGNDYSCVFARDITDRKRYEEEILKRERNLSTTLNSIGDAVIVTDNKGIITRINPVAEKLTGYKLEEAVGKNFCDIVKLKNSETGKNITNIIEQVVKNEKIIELNNRIILTSKDNKEYYINDSGAPIKDENGLIIGCIIVFRDITEEVVLQEQLLHTQKLEALGQLSGGIAHDFNNIMSGIMSTIELMEMEYKENEYIKIIKRFVTRGVDLSHNLLTFSRKGNIKQEFIDIVSIIKDVISLLKNTVDKKIAIIAPELPDKEINIKGNSSQLETAILNIGLNAKDAMPDGGKLTFEFNIVNLDKEFCHKHIINNTPGEYAEIIISDTGTGIDKDILDKIFEPFFTTKKIGKGTGLGLSMVYGTILQHKGGISVYSEKGVGTTFKLYLKIEKPYNDKEEYKEEYSENKTSGNGNIMIIDDEEGITKILSKILEKFGYRTISFNMPNKAIEYFEKNYKSINLILLDIIMPEKRGDEIFKIFKSIFPDVKVIFMSGYSGDLSIEEMKTEGILGFISKPFKVNELTQIIKRVL